MLFHRALLGTVDEAGGLENHWDYVGLSSGLVQYEEESSRDREIEKWPG